MNEGWPDPSRAAAAIAIFQDDEQEVPLEINLGRDFSSAKRVNYHEM
jgi:hypothetical protein